ncbi:nicastrin [Leptopilina boulardi]|uniref:nicastrin n=1 Tax=Leptopilina boulardi TaxID=63433 RepID=UPI0021F5B0DA|nr:nicastrin [Leptopilina boulardi]
MMVKLFNWKFVLLITALEVVAEHRIKDLIYTSIDNVAACFRRQNGTHQFGCSSSRSGSIGAIHFIENELDLKWLENNATADPYIAVVSFSMFTKDTLFRVKMTNKVNGVLMTNTKKSRPLFYSPEDTCPNRYSGARQCNDTKPWNPHGSAILMEDWPFPMFFMEDEKALDEIRSCYLKHNAHNLETQKQRSLCALEMKSFMFAAVDTRTCLRRNALANIRSIMFCEPLGDKNIHWSLSPVIEENNSIILITARLDSTSMFDGLVPGARGTVTGLVTFLATAFYLNSLPINVTDTTIMFSLLNGEAYDYIGSSKMVYDLKEGNFKQFSGKNLDLKQISTVIELGQLSTGELFLHTNNMENNQIVLDLKTSLAATILKDSVPPTSVQSFLKENSTLPTIVLTDYGEKFTNNYYHSFLDDKENVDYKMNLNASLAKVAINLGNVLYKNIMGKDAPKNNKDVEQLITYMLTCYLDSANCSLFTAAIPPGNVITNRTLPLYISVNSMSNVATYVTSQLLTLLTGEEIPDLNSTTCYKKHLAWMKGEKHNSTGICINSTVYSTSAISPAFIIPEYNMTSGVYSTWTESVWDSLSVRMFLKPSAATERLSLILGSSISILSFIVVWFINSRSKIIFNSRTADL